MDLFGCLLMSQLMQTVDTWVRLLLLNSFLLNCEQLNKCNHNTIVKLFNDSKNLLWPKGVKYEYALLFLSDATSFMIKACSILNSFFPKLLHITRLAYDFH